MKAPVLNPDLVKALKALRLGPIADTLPDRLVLADKQQMSFEDVFLLLLTDEISRRQGSAAARRADIAGLDSDLVLERWDKTAKVHFDKRVFQELTSLRFIAYSAPLERRVRRDLSSDSDALERDRSAATSDWG